MNGWDEARAQAKGAALLADVEADLLGDDPDVLADLRRLTDGLAALDLARDQLLTVRSRLLSPCTFGYVPADLDCASHDYRMARRAVTETVTGLAARLTEGPADD